MHILRIAKQSIVPHVNAKKTDIQINLRLYPQVCLYT